MSNACVTLGTDDSVESDLFLHKSDLLSLVSDEIVNLTVDKQLCLQMISLLSLIKTVISTLVCRNVILRHILIICLTNMMILLMICQAYAICQY